MVSDLPPIPGLLAPMPMPVSRGMAQAARDVVRRINDKESISRLSNGESYPSRKGKVYTIKKQGSSCWCPFG